MRTMLALCAFALCLGVSAPGARAQYYERPPPGYYPSPYERGPQPYYGGPPPYYEGRPRPFGRHCEAVLRTPTGPQPLFCRIVEPKPLGVGCACPPPGVGPDFPLSRYVPGTTVR